MSLKSGTPEKIKRTLNPEAASVLENAQSHAKIEQRAETETIASEATETAETETQSNKVASAATVATIPVVTLKNPKLAAVEKILEENIGELYAELPPNKKADFRREGEKVAQVIWLMLETAKIQVQKIVKLIRDWLKIIPGINRYFLEQASKIKTDKIIELARKKKSG